MTIRTWPWPMVLILAIGGCITPTVDADGDGSGENDDCDDQEAASHPGGTEVCDGLDNDCNGEIDEGLGAAYYPDADGDGYGQQAGAAVTGCVAPAGYVVDATDCDDAQSALNPGADETCDGLDNNCDGRTDESSAIDAGTWYADADGDTFGNAASATTACDPPDGYVADGTDCDDSDIASSPAAAETECDAKDNDCDGLDDDHPDDDGDGYDRCATGIGSADANPADCDDDAAGTYPGGIEAVCNEIDDDCDGLDDDHPDGDGDGFDACDAEVDGADGEAADCDDSSAAVNPAADDALCDGLDDDCDGLDDDHPDLDADGYDQCGTGVAGADDRPSDCNDGAAAIHPDAKDTLIDGIDGDCDGKVDLIDTFAGGPGEVGDGGPATGAWLDNPAGTAMDKNGYLYIADGYNNRIRKITPTGIIYTIAGDGTAGFSGDGGQAVDAQLTNPRAVSVDESLNVYISDTYNHRIRVLTYSTGVINTIAGTGAAGYSGDNNYATAAQLNTPSGLGIGNGAYLYVADYGNHRVRSIELVGNHLIRTIAGTGSAGFSGDGGPASAAKLNYPIGLFLKADFSYLYIADTKNNRIRLVKSLDTSSPSIETIAGGGSAAAPGYGDGGWATDAVLSSPADVFYGPDKMLYITDGGHHRVRKLQGSIISNVAGDGTEGYGGDEGPATEAQLDTPRSLAMDTKGTTLYFSESGGNRVRSVPLATGDIHTFAGCGVAYDDGEGRTATDARLYGPDKLAVDGAGNLYIADALHHRIRRVSTTGVITSIVGTGSEGSSGDGGPATSAKLDSPGSVWVDSAGTTLYVADTGNHRVRRVDPDGTISTIAGTGTGSYNGDAIPAVTAYLNAPGDVLWDGLGNVYIADTGNHRVRMIDTQGLITTIAGTGTGGYDKDGVAAATAKLQSPGGLARDTNGNLYIADTGNHRVRKVDAEGTIYTVAGKSSAGSSGDNGPATAATLEQPNQVWIDPTGLLYIADPGANRVRRVSSSGIITTIAGTGTGGYDGDGGPSTGAQLEMPQGLAVDGAGRLFISDGVNDVVRVVVP